METCYAQKPLERYGEEFLGELWLSFDLRRSHDAAFLTLGDTRIISGDRGVPPHGGDVEVSIARLLFGSGNSGFV